MRKIYLLSFLLTLLAPLTSRAEGTITLTTSAPVGTEFRVLIKTTSAVVPVYIDFGDGVETPYTIDPSMADWRRWITANVKGETMKFRGNITEFTLEEAQLTSATVDAMNALEKINLSDNELESFELLSMTALSSIDLGHNKIWNSPSQNPTLSLEYAGKTLKNLTLSYNEGLQCLDMRDLVNLETLNVSNSPDFASLFICMPEATHSSLRSINIANCSLSHFYPVNLPMLRSLDLSNNILMSSNSDDPFELGNYPNLTTLAVSGNHGIKNLDVTACTKLEQLWIADCDLSTIDVSQCPELITLNAGNNNIRTFDLGNNPNITSLHIQNNPVSELDMDKLPKINSLNISGTDISRVDLMKAFYLKSFEAANTKLEFVHFGGQQPSRMEKVDLRNCPGFTYESMAYTLMTLPPSKRAYNTNLFLSGSNAEKSNIDFITNMDYQWKCDVEGDNTAEHTPVAVTLSGATDTGENVTGELDRLYPYMGIGLSYDFDRYSTAGGEFLICQWQPESSQYHPEYFQTMSSVTSTALIGVPIHIYPYPEEGKQFKSVTVNGKEIFSRWFIVSEPSTIKVNFTGAEEGISFTTTPGQPISMLVNTVDSNGTVSVDWGTGTRTDYPGQRSYTSGYSSIGGTRIDGTAAGSTITIYGDVAALDLSGFGDVAADFGLWDNAVTGIDLSGASSLKFLNLHWNPISELDLSGAPLLEVLNVSYTDLKTIDLSHSPWLMWLSAYSDGFDDEDDGISMLESLDVTALPYLQYLDAKCNRITSIDFTHNSYLRYVNLNNNQLSSVDFSGCPILESVTLSGNKITSIDLSANTALASLYVDANDLTSIDLSSNLSLVELSVANNYIHSMDLGMLSELKRLMINGNGMSADELNDLYYGLPQRKPDAEDENSGIGALHYNLAVIQGQDRENNAGNEADSSIAVDRGWTPSHVGTNSGSEVAYLDVLPSVHGSVKIVDGDGQEYVHGSKVPKYAQLTVVPEPEDGYEFAGYSLNNEVSIEGTAMTMPGVYTKFLASFRKKSGIDSAEADAIAVKAVDGGIAVDAAGAVVDIFTPDGRSVVSASAVDGSAVYNLAGGIYIVRVSASGSVTAKSVSVK